MAIARLPAVAPRTLLALSCLALALVPAATQPAQAAPACGRTDGTATPRWTALPQPKTGIQGATQLDKDSCLLVAATPGGIVVRSMDGGEHWTPTDTKDVRRLVSERLELVGEGIRSGPILAETAPTTTVPVPTVMVSGDDGKSFFHVGLVGPGGTVPLSATIHDAVMASHFEQGKRSFYVYLAASVGGTDTLLRSTDGGASYAPLPGAANIRPTAVAVNPTATDEIWVSGGAGGGAYVSVDGGTSFTQVCCAGTTVHDIAISQLGFGYVQVLLATDTGLMRSTDDGTNWTTISKAATYGVRTTPDDAGTILAVTARGVELGAAPHYKFEPLPGLPKDCTPNALRRNASVPPVFLVDCAPAAKTYRLGLSNYGSKGTGTTGSTILIPPLNGRTARSLVELATWVLPSAKLTSGAVAFDGRSIFYDTATPGVISSVDARTGAPGAPVTLQRPVKSLTFDLRANALLYADIADHLWSHDMATSADTDLGKTPWFVPSYDPFSGGLAWFQEGFSDLWRAPRDAPAKAKQVCHSRAYSYDIPSTFVASGDGGGYIQGESDQALLRVAGNCEVTGIYSHRVFSESTDENDALACDTQTFFPQAAVWLRDSALGSVTAYGVPFGFCPMPSALTMTSPPELTEDETGNVCGVLVNRTTGVPAAARAVTLRLDGTVVARAQTDVAGKACTTYVPRHLAVGTRHAQLSMNFAGDSGLDPTAATAPILLTKEGPPPPPPLPPPPPPAPQVVVPVVIPVPHPPPPAAANPPPPNAPPPGQIPAAQPQPLAQGAAMGQHDTQEELAIATNEADDRTEETLAMSSLAGSALLTAMAYGVACGRRRRTRTSYARAD
jgi:photosystem II stability/assembly factor-like uncharacterized protein